MTRTGFTQAELDQLSLAIARATVEQFTAQQIRTQSQANLERWRSLGTWGSAYEEWKELIDSQDDHHLLSLMLDVGERAVRLRQSPPYIGLLSPDDIARLHSAAGHRVAE